ncbi:hypothetical protein H257_05651 [Aphanomyces astaci]|uniref:STI1/HOP DP domain-containing protein n=1 Tax=Aphanomyces astaci TaxID=112090 RepID=W4GPT9_APHAT|nr:hypothetical protein H257_05651 [Aphanomyces astaci]ETV81029.1 hypothetical protein H257_05651 [Aphanomyces astaci]|eukprot:XP_009828887.1 hypothetical protein H257_05651 [Aphanomyces astaci]
MVALGANINATDKHGKTPLRNASERQYSNVVKELVLLGANIRAIDENGWTILHQASYSGHLDIVIELAGHGADINETDKLGRTPLHLASGSLKGEDVVQWLLGAGADVTSKAKDGRTARDVAMKMRYWRTLKVFSQHEQAMLIDRAISSFCSGAYELAFKDANQAMSSSGKKNVSPFAGLGEAFLHRDQYCVALAAFEKGLETNPDDVDCMVGIHDTNESVNVASAFGVPDIWAVLAKDPHTLNLLRAKSFKALIQAVRDHPSQYRRYKEVLVNVLAILQKHRQSIGPPTAAPIQPTIPSQPKAVTSKPVVPIYAAKVADEAIRLALVNSSTFIKGGRSARVIVGADEKGL